MTPTMTPLRKNHMAIRAIVALSLVLGYASFGHSQSYTIAPTPFQTAFSNAGAIINNACIWTYVAGTTTAATTYSDNAGTANANPIRSDSAGRFTAFLVAGSSYKFVYESACTPPSHGTVLRTADNITAVPANAANADITGIAGEALSAGLVVYLSDGSGGKIAGQWYKADSANTYSSSLAVKIAMTPSAIASGVSGTMREGGMVSGLTVVTGTTYYVGTAGALTSTPPANLRQVGIADTTATVVLSANPGIPNAIATVARGGTGVGTLAAHGVLIGNAASAVAVSGAGTTGQVLTSNGASADPTFQNPAGALSFIAKATGTSTTASAVVFTKAFGASELTATDALQIYTNFNDATGNCGSATVESSTDSVLLATMSAVNTTRALSYRTLSIDGTSLTSLNVVGLNAATGVTLSPVITTNWTAAWTLVVKMGSTADGTSCNFAVRLYKLAGQ